MHDANSERVAQRDQRTIEWCSRKYSPLVHFLLQLLHHLPLVQLSLVQTYTRITEHVPFALGARAKGLGRVGWRSFRLRSGATAATARCSRGSKVASTAPGGSSGSVSEVDRDLSRRRRGRRTDDGVEEAIGPGNEGEVEMSYRGWQRNAGRCKSLGLILLIWLLGRL